MAGLSNILISGVNNASKKKEKKETFWVHYDFQPNPMEMKETFMH